MRSPLLNDLPPAPVGKTGWPWTEESPPLHDRMSNGSPWPRVSIVTPSYNQARFIEETIRSVLLQGYPNLEYIIMDGGSTDGSVNIIRKYEKWLSYWVSEPDHGQSHAINKGWDHATGDIVAYINSDDLYFPKAIRCAVQTFKENPKSVLVYSDGLWIDEMSKPLHIQRSGPLNDRLLLSGTSGLGIPQPTTFISRLAVKEVGNLDESLHMAMDLDLWLKLALRYRFRYIPGKPLAALRCHQGMKTQTNVLEDRLCSLKVLERALADPRCPEDITRKRSYAYRRLCLDIAGIYLKEREPRHSLKYLMFALKTQPIDTTYQLGYRILVGAYLVLAPSFMRTLVRRIRGTQKQDLSNVWH